MSYIQIEIGGKLRGLKFTQATNAEIKAKIRESKNDVFAFYCLVWGGLVINNLIKGVENDFTFEDVVDWCDKLNAEQVTSISNCYNSTIEFIDELPADNSNKKKLPAKSTKRNALK